MSARAVRVPRRAATVRVVRPFRGHATLVAFRNACGHALSFAALAPGDVSTPIAVSTDVYEITIEKGDGNERIVFDEQGARA